MEYFCFHLMYHNNVQGAMNNILVLNSVCTQFIIYYLVMEHVRVLHFLSQFNHHWPSQWTPFTTPKSADNPVLMK